LIFKPFVVSLLLSLLLAACGQQGQESSPFIQEVIDDRPAVDVYIARNIITMDGVRPRATAVAVDGDHILAVGSMLDVQRSLGNRSYQVSERFADKVLMPGFIEPHLHPYLAGILLPMEFITPHDWSLPDRQVKGVRGRDAYLRRLRDYVGGLSGDEWAWSWGYHQLFHGALTRADLDVISTTRPIVVWHRSFHEIYLNTAALRALQVDEAAARDNPQVDYAAGHFYENGLVLVLPRLIPRLLEPGRYTQALRDTRAVIHAGGITTIADAAFGTLDIDKELGALQSAGWDTSLAPFRTFLLLDGKALGAAKGHDRARKIIDFMPRRDLQRIRFLPAQVKLFADGAAYSQLMQMTEGYSDGHEGEWLMEPAELEEAARVYWNAGFQIHVHVNGDAGLDAVLEILQKLQVENPRDDHRFTIHHVAYARPDQALRLAALGGTVQANPYYLWALGDKYAEVGLGYRRASQMVPLQSFARTGMRIALHSDFTMAPAQPLLLAWAAATRMTAEGNVLGLSERISLQQALRAITIDAAWQIGQDDHIGSIAAGKQADFTVLEQDPFEVPLESVKDIPIWGTVFEGKLFPLESAR